MLLILPSGVSRIVHLHMDEVGFISQWRAIFAGGLAGVAAALVTYPLEVAETRLIVQNCRQPTYIGVVHTLSKIYRTEGLLALYRGFSLTVLGVFAYSYNNNRFLFFLFWLYSLHCTSSSTIHLAVTCNILHLSAGAFPFSIGCYVVHMNLDKLWQEPPFRFTPLQNFINGCLAAGVAQTLSYPFETVKRKMQVIYHQNISACKLWF